jgi:biotin transporter BioY
MRVDRSASGTLVQSWIHERSLWVDLGLVLAFSLFMAVLAHIAIPLPFTPVPITGQTFGVLLTGALLGSRLGAASMLAYIVEGLAGLPVFAPAGGPATYGYLAGFVAAAFVVGWLAERGWDRNVLTSGLAMLAGEVAIYVFGLLWLSRFVPASKVLVFGFFPFVIGDLIKLVAAAVAVPAGWRLRGR